MRLQAECLNLAGRPGTRFPWRYAGLNIWLVHSPSVYGRVMNARLLWTAVESAAGVLALGLVVWQLRLQVHWAPRRPHAEPRTGAESGPDGLLVAVPGRLMGKAR
jgi:hypothetical protein